MSDGLAALRASVEFLTSLEAEHGLSLDGTLESLERIDDLLREHAEGGAGAIPLLGPMTFEVLMGLGFYLGEVIIAESGAAAWLPGDEDDSDPWAACLVGTTTDYRAYPLGKILKCYENAAAGESLVSFASVAIGLFRGEFGFEPQDGRLQ